MFKYAKYSLFHVMGLYAAFSIIMGGNFIYLGLAVVYIIFVIGDLVAGSDESTEKYNYPTILTLQLWVALPLIVLIIFSALWQVSSYDVLGFGQGIEQLTGIRVLENRGQVSLGQFIACIFLTGFHIGLIGTITAHELTHRTWDRVSLLIGRWLLAFSFDSSFSIEHVYGHHLYVSTKSDPATAPRGRNVYAHIIISTLRGNISAWNIEKKRLQKRHLSILSYHNVAIRGYLMSMMLLILAYQIAGIQGLVLFTLAGLWGKSLLEMVNYMEHYGLVRNPETLVQPRHSWNTSNRVSSWAMFNLTRHSHHHAQSEAPFHELRAMPDAPKMISGYLGTIMITLVPPLWERLMTAKLKDWDENFATNEELELVKLATSFN